MLNKNCSLLPMSAMYGLSWQMLGSHPSSELKNLKFNHLKTTHQTFNFAWSCGDNHHKFAKIWWLNLPNDAADSCCPEDPTVNSLRSHEVHKVTASPIYELPDSCKKGPVKAEYQEDTSFEHGITAGMPNLSTSRSFDDWLEQLEQEHQRDRALKRAKTNTSREVSGKARTIAKGIDEIKKRFAKADVSPSRNSLSSAPSSVETLPSTGQAAVLRTENKKPYRASKFVAEYNAHHPELPSDSFFRGVISARDAYEVHQSSEKMLAEQIKKMRAEWLAENTVRAVEVECPPDIYFRKQFTAQNIQDGRDLHQSAEKMVESQIKNMRSQWYSKNRRSTPSAFLTAPSDDYFRRVIEKENADYADALRQSAESVMIKKIEELKTEWLTNARTYEQVKQEAQEESSCCCGIWLDNMPL